MSNEDLVALIKNGRREMMVVLWEQVEAFTRMLARRYHKRITGRGTEIEDLYQTSFIALTDAVKGYEPDKGVFLTYLAQWLHMRFGEAAGLRTDRSANDPINSPISLDAELEDGGTLADLQPDPRDEAAEVERHIYLEELHTALEKALAELDPEDADTIRQRFYEGMTIRSIAERSGRTAGQIQAAQVRGLHQLYRSARRIGLHEFLDDLTDFYRRPRQHDSPVEANVLRREWLRERYGGNEVTTERQSRGTGADGPAERARDPCEAGGSGKLREDSGHNGDAWHSH